MEFTADDVQAALTLLGELLAEREEHHEVVVIGGGALLLRSWIDRPTLDLDVAALGRPEAARTARPFPTGLEEAVDDVAAVRGLPPRWLNAGPTDLLDLGLPVGFETRTMALDLDGLVVHVAGRLDLICTKLYAAVDQGPDSKHALDLRALAPVAEELRFAAHWTQTHDPSEAFASTLQQALAAFGGNPDDVER